MVALNDSQSLVTDSWKARHFFSVAALIQLRGAVLTPSITLPQQAGGAQPWTPPRSTPQLQAHRAVSPSISSTMSHASWTKQGGGSSCYAISHLLPLLLPLQDLDVVWMSSVFVVTSSLW